jgi:hypothetical protein
MEQSVPADRTRASQPSTKDPAGFSQFVSRVLNQLSLSAWLPAAMLVGGTTLILQLHENRNLDVAAAVRELSAKPLGILVILLFSLVLATTVTQAFEFEVIRILEGYWGSRRIPGLASAVCIGRHVRRLGRLKKRRDQIQQRSFDRTRKVMLAKGLVPPEKRFLLDHVEEDVYGRLEEGLSDEVQAEIDMLNWRRFAPAELLRRQDAIEAAIREYPEDHRLLPTKLGNVLRSSEDALALQESEDLEGFVLRWWQEVPEALQQEHDQYRTRLDLYSLLVFVFSSLALTGIVLVDDSVHNLAGRIGVGIGFFFLATVSYQAAIASAKGFGTVLHAIAEIAATEPIIPEPRRGRFSSLIARALSREE